MPVIDISWSNLTYLRVIDREVQEPALLLTNIPPHISDALLKTRLKDIHVLKFESDFPLKSYQSDAAASNNNNSRKVRLLFDNLHSLELAETLLSPLNMTIEKDGYSPFVGK